MQTIYFHYNGKRYSGYVVSSLEKQPYYFWFNLNDTELIEEIGDDTITFQFQEGKLAPTHLRAKTAALVHEVQQAIQISIDGKIEL